MMTMSPRPQLALTAFRCRACGRHLADTDGRTLYLGTCYFTIRTTLHCRRCANRTVWSPPPDRPTGGPGVDTSQTPGVR